MPLYQLIELPILGDARGSLIALEPPLVPFDVKRVYYIFQTSSGVRRGFHAHKNLQQLAVCVSGSCSFLLDDGQQQVTVRLDRPNLGLHIGSMIWREMFDFSDDCVLMVLANELYSESDYIRSHSEFLRSIE